MLEYLDTLESWAESGKKILLARVIKAKGSSPRPIGSVMLVNNDGNILGSVSGGCVEGEVVKKSFEIFGGDKESLNVGFGVSDEEAWSVGLPCGGGIFTFLQTIDFSDDLWTCLKSNLRSNTACALVTTLDDGSCANTLFTFEGKETVGTPLNLWAEVEEAYEQRANKVIEKGGVSFFIHLFPRKPILLVIGAAHITADLVALANDFGFETVVIDPRGFFTKNTVFQSPPSQILTDYPSEVLDRFPMDNYTYCAILSHDPKVDDNAIEYLLKTDVGYIGALGSRKRHERRRKKLIEQGYSVETVDRIHGPIGEPIHSITAKEIALAIMSQIVKVKNQYQREFLKER